MFTRKEHSFFNDPYFKIVREEQQYIEVQSVSTGHCWNVFKNQFEPTCKVVSFVPMPAVSEDGKIDCSDIKPYKEVRKGFTYFAENDVLFAKITPCMENGKGAVAKGLEGGIGFGSTEFHVLRPIAGKSNPYWLYILTMFESFRVGARKVMTGTGGQLRVPIGYLNDYSITLPPIDLQDRFEEFVHQSDKSKFALKDTMKSVEAMMNKIVTNSFKVDREEG